MKNLSLVAVLILFCCHLCPKLLAQQDTTKSKFKLQLKYSVWANGNFSLGNVHRMLFDFGAKVDWKTSPWLKMTAGVTFAYGEQQRQVAEREPFGDLHATFNYSKRFYYIAFGSIDASNLRKYDLRWLAAGGVGYKIVEKPGKYMSITNALLYESTDFTTREDLSTLRNSTRLFAEFDLFKKRLSLTLAYFAQPSLLEANLRTNGLFTLGVPITKGLKATFNMRHSYESQVALSRANHDWNWTVGVRWER